ncbi:MAG: hypothetical protein MUC87_04115 [Bacteroidia bacterium]|nr:hypothetical protein [Bacteroidia bacterium]
MVILFSALAHTLPAQLNYGLSSKDYPTSSDYMNHITGEHAVVRSLPGALYDSVGILTTTTARIPRSRRYTFSNYYSSMEGLANGGNSAFLVRPVYQLQAGFDAGAGEAIYESALGFELSFDVKKKFGGELRAASGLATVPDYVDSQIVRTQRMPGWGDFAYGDSTGVYSWQHVSGYISWKPNKIFNLQAGRDKHFWGEGYRSLWLSDVSGPMPYLQQSTKIWKLQYTSLFAALSHPGGVTGRDIRTAYSSFHLISYNATRWLNLQVFESIVWQGTDNTRFRGFDVNYLNPLVFYRPVEYSLGSSDNAMLGFGFGVRINSNNRIYGQLILDEFFLREIRARRGWWANKQGLQLGYKSFNLFRVVGLTLQGEVNIVRPYTYAHGSPQQSYTHGGLPLAHILGANFTEGIGILAWDKSRYFLSGKLMVAEYGQDSAGINFGGNPLLSYSVRPREFGNFIGQGITTRLIQAEFKAGWKLRLAFPVVFELTAGIRRQTSASQAFNSAWVLAGLKLTPWRSYRDF